VPIANGRGFEDDGWALCLEFWEEKPNLVNMAVVSNAADENGKSLMKMFSLMLRLD
jgi:hypothetical protein